MSLTNDLSAWKIGGTDPDTLEVVNRLRVYLDSITGELSQSGLKKAGRVTEVELNDTSWTALPPVPLTDRNAISIQNESGTPMKLNYMDNNGISTGVTIRHNGERYYDIKDSIIQYGRSTSGTITIIVEELS